MPNVNDHELLTTGEAAILLRVAPSTVMRWCDTGELRCFKTPGGHRRIWRSDLDRIRLGLGERPLLRAVGE